MTVGISTIVGKAEVDDLFQTFLSQPRKPPQLVGFDSAESQNTTTDESSDGDSSTPKRKRTQTAESTTKKKKPRSDSERKERRRMQNRQAAATSREKKKRFHAKLEGEVASLTTENQRLQERVRLLLEENEKLRAKQIHQNPTSECALTEPPLTTTEPAQNAAIDTTAFATITLESAVLSPQQSEVMTALAFSQIGVLFQILPLVILMALQQKHRPFLFRNPKASVPLSFFKEMTARAPTSTSSFPNSHNANPRAALKLLHRPLETTTCTPPCSSFGTKEALGRL